MTDPHLEAEEISAGTQAAFDWLQSTIQDQGPLVKAYAAKYLNMGNLGPLVTAIVQAVDKVRDTPTQQELPL